MNFKDLLPDKLPFGKKETPTEKFFALDIGFKEVTASLWEVSGKHLNIENITTISFENAEELVDASNQALDEALGPSEVEPDKILFGVPDNWLLDDNLKDEYLDVLKRLVKELDVSPMAYVSTTHAIVHMLQKQTGVPPTVILVELSDPFSVTVVKAGKILGTKIFKRGEDLPQDIEKALMGFTGVEVLPSKIELFGQDEKALDKYKEELTSFNWMSNLPFLHLPKVEVLEQDVGIKAISLAGASEINPEVIYTPQKISSLEPKHSSLIHQNIEAPQRGQRAKEELAAVEHEDELLENAGFISGDIADLSVNKQETGSEVEEPLADEEEEMRLPAKRVPIEPEEYEPPVPQIGAGGLLTKLTAPLASLRRSGGVFKGRRFGMRLIIPIIVILALLAGYLLLPKAKVIVYIDPKVLEKDAQVVADPTVTAVDNQKMIIPGKIVETDVTGADKGTATGKKQVGDSAKGTVDIFNKTNSDQSLAAGTVLLGPNNLQFTLDSSVKVASESATDTGITFGKSTTNVTASQIGPDSNLPSGTKLTVKGQSDSNVTATVNQALSGGTSKDVTVVTADDQKKLLANLTEELRTKAQDQLQGKLTGDEKVLSEGLDEKITSTTYSKNVGDQATDFTLNLVVHYKGTAYSDNDLKQMVSKLVETNVPDGYELNLQDTETQADVSKLESDGRLIFLARFKAKLLPRLDTNALKNQIKGRSPDEAISILKGIENVIDVSIELTPKIPNKIARIPLLPQNISIITSAK